MQRTPNFKEKVTVTEKSTVLYVDDYKAPIEIEIPERLKNSSFLKLYFWYFQSPHYLKLESKENMAVPIKEFFEFIHEFQSQLVTLNGELSSDVLSLFHNKIKADGLSNNYRFEKLNAICIATTKFMESPIYRSMPEWSYEIEKILKSKPKLSYNRADVESLPSLANLLEAYIDHKEGIELEKVQLKSWFADAWQKSQRIRSSLLEIDVIKEELNGLIKDGYIKRSNFRFLNCYEANVYKGLKLSEKQRITRYIQSIYTSKDEFLISTFFHSLNPSLFGETANTNAKIFKRQWSISEITSTRKLFYPRKYKHKEQNNQNHFSVVFMRQKDFEKKSYYLSWSPPFNYLFLVLPSLHEMLLVRDLLGYHQASTSGVAKLYLDDIRFDETQQKITCRSSKNRTGNDGKRAVDTPYFEKGSIEYRVLSDYKRMMESAYDRFPELFEKGEVGKVFPSCYIKSIAKYRPYHLKDLWLYKQYIDNDKFSITNQAVNAARFARNILPLIEENSLTRKVSDRTKAINLKKQLKKGKIDETEFEKRHNELLNEIPILISKHNSRWGTSFTEGNLGYCSFGMTSYRQSAQARDARYSIQKKIPIQGLKDVGVGGIDNPVLAHQHAHDSSTEHDVYALRIRSPIMMESERLFGEQVSKEFYSDAVKLYKSLTDRTQIITLSEFREKLGLARVSEFYEHESDSLEELFSKIDSLNVGWWKRIGIVSKDNPENGEILVVKDPLIVALMIKQKEHIDNNIYNFANIEVAPGSDAVDEKVTEQVALRAYLAANLEMFDEKIISDAEELIKNYELPPFQPL